jgi:chromosome segregation ATPase
MSNRTEAIRLALGSLCKKYDAQVETIRKLRKTSSHAYHLQQGKEITKCHTQILKERKDHAYEVSLLHCRLLDEKAGIHQYVGKIDRLEQLLAAERGAADRKASRLNELSTEIETKNTDIKDLEGVREKIIISLANERRGREVELAELYELRACHDSQVCTIKRLKREGTHQVYEAQVEQIANLTRCHTQSKSEIRALRSRVADRNMDLDKMNKLRKDAQADITRVAGELSRALTAKTRLSKKYDQAKFDYDNLSTEKRRVDDCHAQQVLTIQRLTSEAADRCDQHSTITDLRAGNRQLAEINEELSRRLGRIKDTANGE